MHGILQYLGIMTGLGTRGTWLQADVCESRSNGESHGKTGLFFVLLPVLLCAVCSSACQGWVPVCFLLPPLKFSFLCSVCLLSAPLPVSCLRCLSSYFPVAGCGRLSLFPPSFPSPRLCVCEAPNKTRHLSSDSTSPDQCLVFCTTDFTDSLDILVR